MNKYSELCQEYKRAYRKYWDYKAACSELIWSLVQEMATSLGWPEDRVDFIPILGPSKPHTSYTPWGAMDLGDDGFFHLGMLLIIDPSTRSTYWPPHSLLLPLLVRKQEQVFTVKLETSSEEFKIYEDNPSDREAFCSFIFDTIKGEYERGFIPSERIDKERVIGFERPELPSEDKKPSSP